MELPLVIGVDGSDFSLRALDWAVDAAARHGWPLRLVHASLWERYEGVVPSFGGSRPSQQVWAENIVASATERAQLRNPEVKVSGEVVAEDPADALVRESEEASAVIVGSRGRGRLAQMLLGSVSLSAAGRAHCPVIVVRGGQANVDGSFKRLILGVSEDTGPSSASAAFAVREAQVRGSELLALHIWRAPAGENVLDGGFSAEAEHHHEQRARRTLERALEGLPDPGPGVLRPETFEGQARQVLLDAGSTADLLIVGARRRKGSLGLQLGPVNHALLHYAPCPVAVVSEE
ncbi:universal stress protein [Wenjunlia tyrosinilytica]|nr:universal stress protein [Wenjunlia tyrosinilytica]